MDWKQFAADPLGAEKGQHFISRGGGGVNESDESILMCELFFTVRFKIVQDLLCHMKC